MEALFTLVGFGLFFTAYKSWKLSGMTIALFVVAFNYLLGALFQEVWAVIFLRFKDTDGVAGAAIAPTSSIFWDHNMAENIAVSYISLKVSNLCSIAYLVGMTGYNGRVNIQWVLPSLIIFNILFYLNFYLNILISFSTNTKEFSLRYLDDYGTYLVYLFGGVYGLLVSIFTKNRPDSGAFRERTTLTSSISLIGSFILFSTFIFTSTHIIEDDGNAIMKGRNARFNNGAMVILFSLVSSIVGNYITNLFLNKGYLSIDSIAIGALPGGIIVGGLAGSIENIGAATILGLASGLFSGVYMSKIHPRINRNTIIDTHGLIGPILIISILGTFVVPAGIIIQYFWKSEQLNLMALSTGPETDYRNAAYQLAYFGVTLGISLVTGVILGLLTKASKNNAETDFSDLKFFVTDYGLYKGDLSGYHGSPIPL